MLLNHDCELSPSVLPHPHRSRLKKWVFTFRKILMASTKNPRAHRYLRNHSAILAEKRQQIRSNNIWMIHPFSIFRQWWDFLMIIHLTASLLLVPYKVFDIHRLEPTWPFIKNYLLGVCCLDVLINFFTGSNLQHTNPFLLSSRFYSSGQVELNLQKIASNYFLSSIFDILGSFPTDLFFLTRTSPSVSKELASWLHIFRIISARRYLIKIAEAYNISAIYFGLFSFVPLLMITLHWLACSTWLIPVTVTSLSSIRQPVPQSWINQNFLWEKTGNEAYWATLIRTVTILTRSGVLINEMQTPEDQYVVAVLQSISMLVLCWIVCHGMRLYKSRNCSQLKYAAAVAQLKKYMSYKHLPELAQRRFLVYYEFRFQRRFFQEQEILSTLSTQMRQEIRMHACRKLVENVAFFNNLPVGLLARIVSHLVPEVFLTNDVIVRANMPGDCMYFIATGTVAIYGISGTEICHLEDGAHFGEIAMVMPNERRVATVVAVEVCELYKLERTDFMRTIYPYPVLWESIKKIAVERHEKTQTIDER
ncbi:potassium/sodium hyperpolarization-activated cyclic nucleotide-gated channel 1-like [Cotesia glomerata]|uniref:potassium/sodium hyperpolarization-activated cyclic nucleotide-gated channel 1-like n=1 Tax=Cotesia glomerata TaxID=32391 RepID=UPI001D010FF6|nr:potassium/sodium hyperpolarization-activated cyclic nucleotide-gated channel 1-like [Cotesia glomerata]